MNTCSNFYGVWILLTIAQDPKDTPPPTRVETKEEKKDRKRKEKEEAHRAKAEAAITDCKLELKKEFKKKT